MSHPSEAWPTVGDAITELVHEPTAVQLFAFSAVTWNAHRIHYDRDYARDVEGYPDVLVQAHLHACLLARAATDAWTDPARLVRLAFQNRGIAVPADRLTVSGQVTSVAAELDGVRVELALEERNQRGELCAKASATVVLRDGENR